MRVLRGTADGQRTSTEEKNSTTDAGIPLSDTCDFQDVRQWSPVLQLGLLSLRRVYPRHLLARLSLSTSPITGRLRGP